MNKVMLVGRLTRDPELRSLPSGKHVATFTIATNDFRGGGGAERTEYHPCVAWDRLAEICGQFLSKGQLVDVEGRLQTRQWDDDAGKRHFGPPAVWESPGRLREGPHDGIEFRRAPGHLLRGRREFKGHQPYWRWQVVEAAPLTPNEDDADAFPSRHHHPAHLIRGNLRI